jgi:hypothetical protein
MLFAAVAIFLLTNWLMNSHGIWALLNPFLIPVAIMTKVLLAELSKPRSENI